MNNFQDPRVWSEKIIKINLKIETATKKLHLTLIKFQLYNKYQKYQKMDSAQFGQFVEINFEEFLSKSNQVHCKVIGMVTSISKHKKYIIEVMLNKKSVVRSYKRFSEFESLYELLKNKFPAYEIEEFPSKFQIFGKEDTRKSYFQNLLNQIIRDYAKENLQVNKDLMRIIYNFLTFHIEQAKLRKEMIKQNKMELNKNKENVGNSMETDAKSEDGKKVIKQKIEKYFQNEPGEKKHRGSIDLASPTVIIMRTRSNSTYEQPAIIDQAPEIQQNVYDNEFQIKFANQDSWKTGYIEIKDSNMYIFKSKNDNHFKTCIELYRIQVQFLKRDMNLFDHFCDKTEVNLTRTFNQNQDILSLYHEYDHNKILIRKPCPENYNPDLNRFNTMNLKNQIVQASRKQPKTSNFDGVFNPIGKIFIFIHKIKCNWRKPSKNEKIWLRIKTGAFVHHIMPISYNHDIEVNQGFLLPISNTFERVRVQCYTGKEKKDSGSVIGYFKFSMIEFFVKPERSLVQKLEVNLENDDNKGEDYKTTLQLSLQNLSDFSSIYSNSYSNQFDGTTLHPISGRDDLQDFTISINRIFAIIGSVSLMIRAFQRNVMKFKYPILGYIFFTALLINVAFVPITYIIRQMMVFLFMCIIYQQEHAHIIIKYLLDTYIFSYIHPGFKKPEVLSTREIGHLKWSHQLKYIAEDYHFRDGRLEKKSDKKRDVYEFTVHDRVFVVAEEEQSFFEKLQEVRGILDLVYKIVNTLAFTLEKIANLFCWVDFRKTTFLALIILISTGLASGTTFQLGICLFCTLKLIKGTSYYDHKLYKKNRKFAVYAMRYILEKSFPQIIGGKSIHEHMSYIELDQYISNLSFPIHNQSAQKKLKQQMDRIMGVYLEVDALYPKAIKENNLKLVYLLDMIETCEEKLKLKFIAGEEGISNNYQQLKVETKQVEDVDDWLKQVATNFVMNIPSRLFMVFHKKQLHKIEKAEIKQNIDNETRISTELEDDKKQIKEPVKFEAEPLQFEKTKVIIDPKVLETEAAKQKIVVNKQMSMV